MKQFNIFGEIESNEVGENNYTQKLETVIYKPRNKCPHILELVDTLKSSTLINRINNSNLKEDEKEFLRIASRRHNVFNYELIADYYAHASKDMQVLMEDSALVLIDVDSAIEKGYIKLTDEIAKLYYRDYGKE